MVNLNLPSGEELSLDLENKLTHLFNTATKVSKHLKYSLMSKKREMDEQRKITLKSLPYLGITGIVLFLFMIATLITIPLYQSQHIEAVFAILSPLLAIITSFGSLWFIGYPFSNILTVVPFLVLTIGIDDAFLILAGWRQSNCNLSYTERMGETLVKSGASVTVTSITDVLCFSVGIFSNIPVVQDFCLYTSVALAIDFIYQLTFFTAIVAYCAKRQCLVEKEQKLRSMNLKSISAVYDISGSSTPETVIVMSFLVLLFIYDIGAIISVIISILSISGGTVAYLHIWNVHLDAVSLISILLSIGFSVDYSAHICYHYFTHNQTEDHVYFDSPINIQIENQGNNANKKNIFPQQMFTKNNELEKQDKELTTYDKIESTFQAVGWPVIQSGVSTVIGMIPLIFVEAYVVDVFWKTIVLVTVLGMFHALFVLPVMFLLVSDIKKIRKKMMLGNKLKNVPNK
uniref:SSD domain-containing protein n=1 Tax=Rhabditophanes sp. KR3021 TaxID=114890 RepID=A0AC35U435_9BILA